MAGNWEAATHLEVIAEAEVLVEQAQRAVAAYITDGDLEGYRLELHKLTARTNEIPADKLRAVLCGVLGALIWPSEEPTDEEMGVGEFDNENDVEP